MVSEFVGALRPPQIEQFLDELVPSAADKLAATDDEESLRRRSSSTRATRPPP